MVYYFVFAVAGYLMGSILFAPVFGRMIKNRDIIKGTKDQNPGTANAFMQGGPVCGCLTLACELLKGFLPVFLCLYFEESGWALWLQRWNGLDTRLFHEGIAAGSRLSPDLVQMLGRALVITAPVLGHIFPLFFHLKGGKGIAVTFGSLLGLAPDLFPVLTLVFFFLLFSLVIRISPHFYRTLGTYIFAALAILFGKYMPAVKIAFLLITLLVCWKMHRSTEQREECKVRLLWMR